MSSFSWRERGLHLAVLSGTSLLGLALLSGCGAVVVSAAAAGTGQQAGTVLSFLGLYSSSRAYVTNDVVMYQGSSYVAIVGSTNVLPVGAALSASDWVLLAQAGSAGLTGPAGVAGMSGPAGPVGAKGPAGAVGANGAAGLAGPAGLTGPIGPTGRSGAAGSPGLVGPAGPAGSLGVQGPAGAAGSTGTPGSAGPQGVAGPTGPTGPQGPRGAPGAGVSTGTTFLAGRRLGVLGDSISSYLFGNAWQNVVVARTGMTLAVQDARPGRASGGAFECWGDPPPGGRAGTFHASYAFVSTAGTCGSSSLGLSDGMTFADGLANIDLEIVELGTNDMRTPLGQPGDAPNAGTFYGNMRWIVETYLTAKPTLRMVLLTPEYTSLQPTATIQQNVDAMVAYGKSMGVPVINMYALGGVNAVTLSTMTRDGIHPSDFAYSNVYGPVIAQQLQGVF